MKDFFTDHEVIIRLGMFFGIFLTVAVWEMLAPRRKRTYSKAVRWLNNLSLVTFNSVVLRLLFPTAAVGVALWAEKNNIGLFNQLSISIYLNLVLSIILMDLVIYWQHRMMHQIPILWRLHRVHHADVDYDVTTGARFHPLEIIVSMLIKFGTILVLGPSIVAVILFEVILNGMSMFNHGNIRLPKKLDLLMRKIVVTPDMHSVHHSTVVKETNSNYGFNLSIWDKLFGSYRAYPEKGCENLDIGLKEWRNPKQVVWLTGLLSLPFKK